ncbi:MAG: hypothetical protein MPJ50_03100 [Pirellulales bacterium]|nr:hypothetical protein [Pirellulales bacterium]
MRNALVVCLALFAFLGAAPAFAEDGGVSRAQLTSLGLGNIQPVSDDEGLKVRGRASFASTDGNSVAFVNIFPFVDFAVGADVAASPVGPSFASQANSATFAPLPFAFSSASGGSFAFAW